MLFWCGLTLISNAQVPNGIGAKQIGVGGCNAATIDIWSVKNNPGAFGKAIGTKVAMASQHRFNLLALGNHELVIGHQKSWGSLGSYLQYTGFDAYRQIQCGGAYSKLLSQNVALGINLNYHWVGFGDIYGFRQSVSGSLGLHYALSNTLQCGVVIQNFSGTKSIEKYWAQPPTLFKLSTKYAFSDKVNFLLELEQSLMRALNLKTGIEISELTHCVFRAGFNTNPFQTAFGFGLDLTKITVDLGTLWHTDIGVLTSLGIEYSIK